MSAQGSRDALQRFEDALVEAAEAVERFAAATASGAGGELADGVAGGEGGARGVGGARGSTARASALARAGVGAAGAALGFVATQSFQTGASLQTSALNAAINIPGGVLDAVGLGGLDPNQRVRAAQSDAERRTANLLVPLAEAGVRITDEQRSAVNLFFAQRAVRGQQEIREIQRTSAENLAAFTSLNPATQGPAGQLIQQVLRGLGVGGTQ